MGCGSSGHVVPAEAPAGGGGSAPAPGSKQPPLPAADPCSPPPPPPAAARDDLPTLTLPETGVERPKPPLAFEIPLAMGAATGAVGAAGEAGVAGRRTPPLPPRLQRRLERQAAEITLPDIESKLADAETRRQMILQQRAASASRRAQRAMKLFHEMETFDRSHDLNEGSEKYGSTNTLKIPAEHEPWTDRNI